MIHRGLLLGVALAALLSAGPHNAIGQPAQPAATERGKALFDKAAAEMDAGKYAAACPRLEEVVQLVPEGIGARETLGECYDKLGKLASAWRQYRDADELARKLGKPDRARAAARAADRLKPRLSTLTVDLPEGVRQIPGLAVTRNGSPVAAAEWGAAVPVDGGSAAIVVTAPGHKTYRRSLEIKPERAEVHLDIPALERDAAATPEPSAAAPKPAPSVASPVATGGSGPSLAPAIVAGGAGVAALAAGIALFVVSNSDYDKAAGLFTGITKAGGSCGSAPHPDCAALQKAAEESDALYAPGLGLMIGGAVLAAAGGAYLGYALRSGAPARTGTGPRVTTVRVRGAGLLVEGSF